MLRTTALLLALPLLAPAATVGNEESLERALGTVRAASVEADIHFLASDELLGRDTPSEGLRTAARYLRARLMRHGFEPAGDGDSYFDEYKLEQKRLDVGATNATLRVGETTADLIYGKAYVFSPREVEDKVTEGGLMFLGDGAAGTAEGLDFTGMWAVAIDSPDVPWRTRRATAREAGAIGLLVVPAKDGEPFTRRYRRWTFEAAAGSLTLPASGPTDPMFPQVYLDPGPAGVLRAYERTPGERIDGSMRDARAVAEGREEVVVENVCGLWPGSDPELGNELLIVTAHYDHVGARDGDIYNGADDNGSGTSGLLAVAEALAAHGPLKRSVLLMWVSGEEKGLLGSKAWCADPTLGDPYRPVANINIDMIGRNAPDSLLITPTEARPEHNKIVEIAQSHAPAEGFGELGSCDDYWSRSDHASFSEGLGIPVAFLFSDIHDDYHQPTDTAEKIDTDKIARVARLVVRILVDLQDGEI